MGDLIAHFGAALCKGFWYSSRCYDTDGMMTLGYGTLGTLALVLLALTALGARYRRFQKPPGWPFAAGLLGASRGVP